MKNYIQTGDYIVGNKWHYGPIWPSDLSEVSWLNILSYLNIPLEKVKIRTRRWPNRNDIERSDVVIFKHIDNKNIVKR